MLILGWGTINNDLPLKGPAGHVAAEALASIMTNVFCNFCLFCHMIIFKIVHHSTILERKKKALSILTILTIMFNSLISTGTEFT